jgi:hypothetical protein
MHDATVCQILTSLKDNNILPSSQNHEEYPQQSGKMKQYKQRYL